NSRQIRSCAASIVGDSCVPPDKKKILPQLSSHIPNIGLFSYEINGIKVYPLLAIIGPWKVRNSIQEQHFRPQLPGGTGKFVGKRRKDKVFPFGSLRPCPYVARRGAEHGFAAREIPCPGEDRIILDVKVRCVMDSIGPCRRESLAGRSAPSAPAVR